MSKITALKASAVATLTMFAIQAHAALPTPVSGFFTGLSTDFAELEGYAWPVLMVITGGFIWMKLAKRAANKAT
jgi:hypothetical protein